MLAIGEKRRVTSKVENFPIEITWQQVRENLKVFPLGTYDILFGIDWLEAHLTLVKCKEKTINFLTQEGKINSRGEQGYMI